MDIQQPASSVDYRQPASSTDYRRSASGDRVGAQRIQVVAGSPPERLPGHEYDCDGYLYKCPVENPVHLYMGRTLHMLLDPYLRRRHGDAALVTGDVGLYPYEGDRRTYLVPDLLVSLTAGTIGAPHTPSEALRKSYKLWQEPVPDLVLEIVSARSGRRDVHEKPPRYEAMGVSEYWLFDRSRRWVRTAGGLRCLRLDSGGRYRQAQPQVPREGEAPVPAGVVSFWSEARATYRAARDGWVRLHDPCRGLLKSGGEWEEAWEVEKEARSAEEKARLEAEEARAMAEEGWAAEKRARSEAEQARLLAEQRSAALEAELRALRRSMGKP